MFRRFTFSLNEKLQAQEAIDISVPPPAYDEHISSPLLAHPPSTPIVNSSLPATEFEQTPTPDTNDRAPVDQSLRPPPLPETGAYVIKHAGGQSRKPPNNVITVQLREGNQTGYASINPHDKSVSCERQIWWVERCSEISDIFSHNASGSATTVQDQDIYTITNITHWLSIRGDSRNVESTKRTDKLTRSRLVSGRFAPDVFWRIKPILIPSSVTSKKGNKRKENETSCSWGFSITNLASGLPLLPKSTDSSSGPLCTGSPNPKKPTCRQIAWQLLSPPLAAVETRFFRIRPGRMPPATHRSLDYAAPSGNAFPALLRHDHSFSLPYIWHRPQDIFTPAPPHTLIGEQSSSTANRQSTSSTKLTGMESLATQWSISALSAYNHTVSTQYAQPVYVIRNRLTGAYLRNAKYVWGEGGKKTEVATCPVMVGRDNQWKNGLVWRLEKKQRGLWKLVSDHGDVLANEYYKSKWSREGTMEVKMKGGDQIEGEGMFWVLE